MAPPSNSKKRSAGDRSSGPQNKKPRVTPAAAVAKSGKPASTNGKDAKPTRRGGQNVSREPKKAVEESKRKAPITGRKYEEDAEEDEDVDMDDLEEDEFDDEDVEMDAGGEPVEGEVPSGIDGEQAKRLSKGESSAHAPPIEIASLT